MIIQALKTHKVTVRDRNLIKILDRFVTAVKNRSILVITSKIVSICEGRIIKTSKIDKKKLVEKEAEFFIPPEKSKYNITLTIKRNLLIPTAGIDESNGNGYYILWPRDPQKTANEVRKYLSKKFKIKNLGVIITDSKTSPLRLGTTGIALAHSGFKALNNYIGKIDIFGKQLLVTQANIVDGLAAAAVMVMGEGKEQTPLALIEDLPFVEFQNRDPSPKEVDQLHVKMSEDLYTPLLESIDWKKGKRFS